MLLFVLYACLRLLIDFALAPLRDRAADQAGSIDRRVTWFELTAAGDSLLDEIVNVVPARVGEALSVLTPEGPPSRSRSTSDCVR